MSGDPLFGEVSDKDKEAYDAYIGSGLAHLPAPMVQGSSSIRAATIQDIEPASGSKDVFADSQESLSGYKTAEEESPIAQNGKLEDDEVVIDSQPEKAESARSSTEYSIELGDSYISSPRYDASVREREEQKLANGKKEEVNGVEIEEPEPSAEYDEDATITNFIEMDEHLESIPSTSSSSQKKRFLSPTEENNDQMSKKSRTQSPDAFGSTSSSSLSKTSPVSEETNGKTVDLKEIEPPPNTPFSKTVRKLSELELINTTQFNGDQADTSETSDTSGTSGASTSRSTSEATEIRSHEHSMPSSSDGTSDGNKCVYRETLKTYLKFFQTKDRLSKERPQFEPILDKRNVKQDFVYRQFKREIPANDFSNCGRNRYIDGDERPLVDQPWQTHDLNGDLIAGSVKERTLLQNYLSFYKHGGYNCFANLIREVYKTRGKCSRPFDKFDSLKLYFKDEVERIDLENEEIRKRREILRKEKVLESSGLQNPESGEEKVLDNSEEEPDNLKSGEEQILDKFANVVRLAMMAYDILPKEHPIYRLVGNVKSATFSQAQCAAFLAQKFFCGKDGFEKILNLKGPNCRLGAEKIKFLMNYFDTVACNMPNGNVSFRRVVGIKDDNLKKFETSTNKPRVQIWNEFNIEDSALSTQVDFANKDLGGGVLNTGAVQEEIRFLMCPEMMVGMFLCGRMKPMEAISIVGAQCYSSYSGYGRSGPEPLKWEPLPEVHKHSRQNTIDWRDKFRRLRNECIAIDAISFAYGYGLPVDEQFRKQNVLRELHKAYVGFSAQPSLTEIPIVTGWWGCGAFRGDKGLKFIIQLIAAAVAGRPLILCPFDQIYFGKRCHRFVEALENSGETASDLFKILCKLPESCPSPSNSSSWILNYFQSKLRIPGTISDYELQKYSNA